ncbi:VOC family protein [Streptomyces sp. RY43-2]|uniref:VOC family protein n=1 Tax=Streptomyces macrolidinus TaxID=2952607 RepID=A0ABT0Z679_9ACTN|nr:VOC family protein [Streptomyces macrolidinus]MCN9239275.1 VOC family protein [Streptomyces macrolidinus]
MASVIRHVTIDCADPYTLASFWAEALDGSPADDDFPGDPEAMVRTPTTTLLFIRVDDAKTTKNRVHLDFQPQDRTRDEEVDRLLSLGATLHSDHRRPDGTGWVTLQDLEGNELCVERSAGERAQG